jgi:hypothetical protein
VNKKDTLTEQFNKMNQRHVTIKADMIQTNKKRKKTKEIFPKKGKLNEREITELSESQQDLFPNGKLCNLTLVQLSLLSKKFVGLPSLLIGLSHVSFYCHMSLVHLIALLC